MINAWLNKTVAQLRVTARTSDGQGGFPAVETVINPALRVRISSGSVQERERGGRRESYYRSTLFAAANADIKRGDVLERADGSRLVVEFVRDLSIKHHVEAIVEETRAGA